MQDVCFVQDVCAGVSLHGFSRRSWRDEGPPRTTMLLLDVTSGCSAGCWELGWRKDDGSEGSGCASCEGDGGGTVGGGTTRDVCDGRPATEAAELRQGA